MAMSRGTRRNKVAVKKAALRARAFKLCICGKRGWPTEDRAVEAVGAPMGMIGGRIYRCDSGLWHVTSHRKH